MNPFDVKTRSRGDLRAAGAISLNCLYCARGGYSDLLTAKYVNVICNELL